MTTTTQPTRYHAVAVTLHWLIALGIVGLLVVGFIMGDVEDHALKFKLYQLHKSFGITILALSLARLLWRLTHRPPALPPGSKSWEKGVAHLVHWGFYAMMIGMPLVGWLGVSASPMKMPLRIFNLFSLPLLPFFNGDANPRATAEGLFEAHELMAYGIIGLLVLHLGAVVKHHFILRNDVLLRMAPKFLQGTLQCLRGKDA
jgi:cytochrome b561